MRLLKSRIAGAVLLFAAPVMTGDVAVINPCNSMARNPCAKDTIAKRLDLYA